MCCSRMMCAGVVAAALGIAACTNDSLPRNPVAPTLTPRPGGSGQSVSGSVFEHTITGVTPLAGVPLRVFLSPNGGVPRI